MGMYRIFDSLNAREWRGAYISDENVTQRAWVLNNPFTRENYLIGQHIVDAFLNHTNYSINISDSKTIKRVKVFI